MYDCIWSVAGKSAVEICGIENVALKQGAPAGELACPWERLSNATGKKPNLANALQV